MTETQTIVHPSEKILKIIHPKGNETVIKSVDVGGESNNKYTVFISSSVGCPHNCFFCGLKGGQVEYLSLDDVVTCTSEAISQAVSRWPELADKNIKLAWMGMGDPLDYTSLTRQATQKLLHVIFTEGYAQAIDRVDISTMIPSARKFTSPNYIDQLRSPSQSNSTVSSVTRTRYKNKTPFEGLSSDMLDTLSFSSGVIDNRFKDLRAISRTLGNYPIVSRHVFESPLRVFISLFSADPKVRSKYMEQDNHFLEHIKRLSMGEGYCEVGVHYVPIRGINDSFGQIESLVNFMKTYFPNGILKILEFNPSKGSKFAPADKIRVNHILLQLEEAGIKCKLQQSPGSKIKAACGQFF